MDSDITIQFGTEVLWIGPVEFYSAEKPIIEDVVESNKIKLEYLQPSIYPIENCKQKDEVVSTPFFIQEDTQKNCNVQKEDDVQINSNQLPIHSQCEFPIKIIKADSVEVDESQNDPGNEDEMVLIPPELHKTNTPIKNECLEEDKNYQNQSKNTSMYNEAKNTKTIRIKEFSENLADKQIIKVDVDQILKENIDVLNKPIEIVINNQKFGVDKAKNSLQPLAIADANLQNSQEGNQVLQNSHKTKACQVCGRKFSQQGDLTRHERIHSGVKPFKCSASGCDMAFISSGDLKKHFRRKHEKKEVAKNYKCDICNKQFEKKYDLDRHQLRHKIEKNENVGYRCELCQKSFPRKDQLKAHTYRHLSIKPYTCEVCSKGFSDASNFSKHKKTHSMEPVDLTCRHCDREFKHIRGISSHKKSCPKQQNKQN